MTSSPTHPYHSVPRRPSWEALPQLSIFPRGSPLASYCWWIPYLWMAGPGKHVWVWQMRRGWWERVKNKNESQKNKRELGYEQNGEGEKRGKKHRREREKWEAHSGEDKVLPFFLLFLTGQLKFFPLLSLLFFFDTGSRDWITRVKPPGVLPSLLTPFSSMYALCDHLRHWLHARSPWQPRPIWMWEEIFCPFLLSLYLLLMRCFFLISVCAVCVFF